MLPLDLYDPAEEAKVVTETSHQVLRMFGTALAVCSGGAVMDAAAFFILRLNDLSLA